MREVNISHLVNNHNRFGGIVLMFNVFIQLDYLTVDGILSTDFLIF